MSDKFFFWLAGKFPPRLLYFCIIRAWALALEHRFKKRQPDTVTFSMVCAIFENRELEKNAKR
jgi:hypothetical protein